MSPQRIRNIVLPLCAVLLAASCSTTRRLGSDEVLYTGVKKILIEPDSGVVLTPAAEQALFHYPWPGNIRELRNTLERVNLLTDSRSIGLDHLFDRPIPQPAETQNTHINLRDYLNECERDFIVRSLEASQWHIQCCADTLGISRKNLWEKMRKLGIDKAAADDGSE